MYLSANTFLSDTPRRQSATSGSGNMSIVSAKTFLLDTPWRQSATSGPGIIPMSLSA